jgi:hypothetical protein
MAAINRFSAGNSSLPPFLAGGDREKGKNHDDGHDCLADEDRMTEMMETIHAHAFRKGRAVTWTELPHDDAACFGR